MKFQDMPYERIDFAKVQEEMGEVTVKGKIFNVEEREN